MWCLFVCVTDEERTEETPSRTHRIRISGEKTLIFCYFKSSLMSSSSSRNVFQTDSQQTTQKRERRKHYKIKSLHVDRWFIARVLCAHKKTHLSIEWERNKKIKEKLQITKTNKKKMSKQIKKKVRNYSLNLKPSMLIRFDLFAQDNKMAIYWKKKFQVIF